ncbi:MAG: aminoacyl-tRNA hydrolase [Bacteroidales bacterium]|jgi:ribosome-associated protein|nr:aminoacyl-tRNA hydrolase [Bacteroidales bacterium]NMD03073.1 aminoacyl-tRNA hydrolase [Bacteroidales bacterium]OQB65657.1 MAG: Peptidyl-tRNA hydrolase ArfB [Bacteroidetes bacterium ADurb.Bin145]HOU02639.1 alternative ribosome rescue aminoacyl-tRNA hydrolase ArfB [Bacteroidales bacterium]HQK67485.1 alternative ribosome rescue aminoacyl-tRNA hydrolase ArfB [Bacteroidales bacterium]
MKPEELKERIPSSELRFTATRSSGPGGQNVNKVNTRIELRFSISGSPSLSGDEKNKILTALKNRITSEGEIVIISQSERSQLMNRRKAEEKFFNLLAKILTPVPERKSTSPTQASKLKRIDGKRKRSAKKRLRNEKGLGEERD